MALPVSRPKLLNASSSGTPVTTATGTTMVAAPRGGFKIRVWRFHVSNGGATSTWVWLRDGAAGTRYYGTYLPTNGVISIRPDGECDLSEDTAAILTTSAAGSVEWHLEYEIVPNLQG